MSEFLWRQYVRVVVSLMVIALPLAITLHALQEACAAFLESWLLIDWRDAWLTFKTGRWTE